MTSSERNMVIRIARGEVDEEKVKLTEEQKEELETTRAWFKKLKEAGLENMIRAYCVDDDSL